MSLPNYYNVDFLECTGLNVNETTLVTNYTMTAYLYVNEYLQNNDDISTYKQFDSKIFAKYFYMYIKTNKNSPNANVIRNINARINVNNESNLEWFRNIMYKYTIDLYHIIKKCTIQIPPFRVFRGTARHYLKEDTDNYYYINKFTSTSTEKMTAMSFSKGSSNNALYIFYVQPGTEYLYIGDIEDEVLINLYNMILFLKKETTAEIVIYHYIIIPSKLQMPSTYNTFKPFKNTIASKAEPVRGGRMNINKKTRKQRIYSNKTRKNYNHVAPPMTLQERIKEYRDMQDAENKLIEGPRPETARERYRRMRRETRQELGLPEETDEERMEHFRRRMEMPIGISRGFPVTEEMRQQAEEMKRLFNL
jgi:hypothetical protein